MARLLADNVEGTRFKKHKRGLARAATKVAGQIQHGHGLTAGKTRNTKEGWQSGKCSRATTVNDGLGSRNKSKGDLEPKSFSNI